MSLAPLLAAPPAIQIHAFAAMAAFLLGGIQVVAPKGTLPHRTLGWVWVALMVVVAVSAFWIHELRVIGPWSPIHLLSIVTLVTLPYAIYAARRGVIVGHKSAMLSLYFLALILAGAFTFLPDRIMHAVAFGG